MRSGRVTTAAAFGLGAAALLAVLGGSNPESQRGGSPTVTTRRGDLSVSLTEPGTLRAAQSITLASEIRSNRAKIVDASYSPNRHRLGEV